MLAAGQPTIFNHSWPKYSCWSTKRYIYFFWLSMADAQGREAILDAILPFLQTKAKGVSTFKEELQSYSHIGDTSFFFLILAEKAAGNNEQKDVQAQPPVLSVFSRKNSMCYSRLQKWSSKKPRTHICHSLYNYLTSLSTTKSLYLKSSTIMTPPRDLDFSFFLGKRKEELFQPPWMRNYVTFFFHFWNSTQGNLGKDISWLR